VTSKSILFSYNLVSKPNSISVVFSFTISGFHNVLGKKATGVLPQGSVENSKRGATL